MAEKNDQAESEDVDMWGDTHTVLVHRDRKGFGFTLRHFIVYPADLEKGSAKTGLLKDGSESKRAHTPYEPMDTIFVKQVKEGGPAHSAGLRKGDRIVSVNGQNVTGKSYSQVIALIQASDQSLKLLVVPKDKDVLQMVYQRSAYAAGKEPYQGTAGEIPDPPQFSGKTSGTRYKSELKVVPEDSPQLDAHGGGGGIGAAPRQRTSLSSVGSGSTSASSGGGHIGSSRDSLHRAAPTGTAGSLAGQPINLSESLPANTGSKFGEQLLRSAEAAATKLAANLSHSYHGTIQPPTTHKQQHKDNSSSSSSINNSRSSSTSSSTNSSAPAVQSRTSSRNILLKYQPEQGGVTTAAEAAQGRHRAGSLDSISRPVAVVGAESSAVSTRAVYREGGAGQQQKYQQQQQRLSMPVGQPQTQQQAYSSPGSGDMGNGTTSQRSRSRDREQDYKQQQQSQQQMGNSWAAASGNPAGVGSGGDLRSSTDELRRRFFENGLGNQSNAMEVSGGSASMLNTGRYNQPYTRANTTTAESARPIASTSSQPDVSTDSILSGSQPHNRQQVFSATSVTSTPPPHAQQFKPISGSTPADHHPHSSHQRNQSTPESYGLTVSLSAVSSVTGSVSGTNNTSDYLDNSNMDSVYGNTPQQRHSLQEPASNNNANLVTERMKLFESDTHLEMSAAALNRSSPVTSNRSRSPRLELMQKAPQAYGSNSVATKAAFYETKDQHAALAGGGRGSRTNSGGNSLTSSTSSLLQTLPPEELHKGPSTPVSSIPFYFRTEASPITVERSPERSKATNVVRPQPQHQPLDSSPRLDVHSAGSRGHSRDRSPMGSFKNFSTYESLSPSPEPREFRRQKPTRRQPSYLTAIDNAKLAAYLDRLHASNTSTQPIHASIDSVTAANAYDQLSDKWSHFQHSPKHASTQSGGSDTTKSLESLTVAHHQFIMKKTPPPPRHPPPPKLTIGGSNAGVVYSSSPQLAHKKIPSTPPLYHHTGGNQPSKHQPLHYLSPDAPDDLFYGGFETGGDGANTFGGFGAGTGGILGTGSPTRKTSKMARFLSPFSYPGTGGSNPNVGYSLSSSQDGYYDQGGYGGVRFNSRASKTGGDVQDGSADPVRLRSAYTSEEDREQKIMRRTSYLMATRQASTGGNQAATGGNQPTIMESSALGISSSSESQQVVLHPGHVTTFKRQERSKLKLTLRGVGVGHHHLNFHHHHGGVAHENMGVTHDNMGVAYHNQGNVGVAYATGPAPMSPIPQSPRTPTSPKSPLSPKSPFLSPPEAHTGASGSKPPKNLNKLKAFFGERTPKIVEAHKCALDLPPSPVGDVILEGTLGCKLAMTDGKRSSDRSWKPMWAVLRGHALYLYKDKASVSPLFFEESPISIKSAIADIAYDYTKKKNVFRLTTYNGSEYLFQADDQGIMLNWIRAIQDNNNPDKDNSGVSSQELISRKICQVQQSAVPHHHPDHAAHPHHPHHPLPAVKTSPPPTQLTTSSAPVSFQAHQMKIKPKVSSRSLRSKSPAAHSPGMKQKKQGSKEDYNESPKSSKTWKDKMAKKFKRSGSSSNNAISESSEVESQVSFGVPIDECPSSTFSEYVPFAVEICTKIVEAKGLENQGIYRVPGNNGAVNMLQAELDKGRDLFDMDNEKWLDVNVVSSLLKLFFRKLPEPLITEELYDHIIQANRIENQEKRMLKMKKILHDLPEHNFETFSYLGRHLNNVISKEKMNKMDARNIAIVFGPTLVCTAEDSMITMVKDMSDQCRIIESIVMHPHWFFGSWDEDVYVPIDKRKEGGVPISGMNLQLLNKAENMELGERGREFSAKDIMSSVFSAANKKVRRRGDKSKGDSIDADMESESGYNERNIDLEVELRSKQVSSALASQSAAATMSSSKLEMKSSLTAKSLQNPGQGSQSASRLDTMSHSTTTTKQQTTTTKETTQTSSGVMTKSSSTISTSQQQQLHTNSSASSLLSMAKTSSMQGPFPGDVCDSSDGTKSCSSSKPSSPPSSSTTSAAAAVSLSSAKMEFFQQPPQPVSLQPHFTLGPTGAGSASSSPQQMPGGRKSSLGSSLGSSGGAGSTFDREDFQVKRYPAYPPPVDFRTYATEASKPVIHYKYSQRGITPPPGGAVSRGRPSTGSTAESPTTGSTSGSPVKTMSSGMPQQTDNTTLGTSQNTRIETDTAALNQKEVNRKRELEEREIAKQRIELELQKAKEDLEQEDEFDLYSSGSSSRLPPSSTEYGYSGGGGGGKIIDTSDFTSDYSTNSSNTNTLDSKASLRVVVPGSTTHGYGSDYSSSASPSISRMQKLRDVSPQPPANWNGSKYLSLSSSSPRMDRHNNRLVVHDDMELYRHPSPREMRAGAFDFAAVLSNKTAAIAAIHHHRYYNNATTQDVDGNVVVGGGGNLLVVKDNASRVRRSSGNRLDTSRHGGSLDSLIDQYDRLDWSFCESDSSEHEDLLQSLTDTFDFKMRSLIEKESSALNDGGIPGKGQVILAQGDRQHFVPSSFVDKFRDPSLHRVTPSKGEQPKIGIACRFERKDIDSQFRSEAKSPSVAKSEKTEANVNIKCNQTPHAKVYATALRKSGEKLYGSRENLFSQKSSSSSSHQADNNSEIMHSPSASLSQDHPQVASPPSQRSKRGRFSERRRHTVGGTQDAEHMTALLTAYQRQHHNNQSQSKAKSAAGKATLSAWEQLQPIINRSSHYCEQQQEPPRDVQSWLTQQQRLRSAKSTPSLNTDACLLNNSRGGGDYYNFGGSSKQYYQPQKSCQESGSSNVSSDSSHYSSQQKQQQQEFTGFYDYGSFSPSENRRRRRLHSSQKTSSESSPTSPTSPLSPTPVTAATDANARTRQSGFTFESSI